MDQGLDKAIDPWLTRAERVPDPVEMVELEGIEAGTRLKATTLDQIASLPGGESPSRMAGLGARLYDRKGHQAPMGRICRPASSARMGVHTCCSLEGVEGAAAGRITAPASTRAIGSGVSALRGVVVVPRDLGPEDDAAAGTVWKPVAARSPVG